MEISSSQIADPSAPLRVERVVARILDIPTIREHKLSFGAIVKQSPVVVQLWLSNGAIGFGEAATIGGPSWNEESPESILHAIQAYLAPAVTGQDAGRFAALSARMDGSCKGNSFAKSAVEMALIDAVARSHGLPAWQLLGGKHRDSLPLAWTLASGNIGRDIEEAERMMLARRHRIFKIKIGARSPQDDVSHVAQIARALAGRASMTIDVNQAWDGNTARRYLPELIDSGVTLIEQPVAKWNIQALSDLTASLTGALVMADESICTPNDALQLAQKRGCHVFSLKVAKHGGLLRTKAVAAVAEAADIDWYGGTMLETSLGSAAAAHVFATLTGAHQNCELFGPQLLVDDIVDNPMVVRDFELQLPDGPGFGVDVSEERLQRFDRARQGLEAVSVDFGRNANKG
ncbi:muconate cycloisomerase family protein [soil metagenome]